MLSEKQLLHFNDAIVLGLFIPGLATKAVYTGALLLILRYCG